MTARQSRRSIVTAAGLDGPVSFVVRLRVSDDFGNTDEDTATVQVLNKSPTVSVSNSGPIEVGRAVTITAVGSDPGGANDPLSYEFDCDGDGLYEIGPQAARSAVCVFDRAETYTVAVRAADGDVRVTITERVRPCRNESMSLTREHL